MIKEFFYLLEVRVVIEIRIYFPEKN